MPLPQLILSRPTFLELSNAISKAGLQVSFDEDGRIHLPDMIIGTDANVLQADRLAAAIAESSKSPETEGLIFEEGGCVIRSRCRPDGVHLIEERHEMRHGEVVLPRACVPLVAVDLMECMARPVEPVCSPTPAL